MTRFELHTRNSDTVVHVTINQDLFTCMIPAAIAAFNAFLTSYMACLSGGSTPDKLRPGNRQRCG